MIDRLQTHCLLRPEDIAPSQDDLEVVGVFNPGAVRFADEIAILARVAERPRPRDGEGVPLTRYDLDAGRVAVDWAPECDYKPIDPRLVRCRDGTIRLEDVTFAYLSGEPALRDVSLEVPAGRVVALVGSSGAGKSTVLNVILRFYDVDSGRVTIDGTDVRDVTLASLREAVALVSQDIVLFDATVHANIAYGRPEADRDTVEAAARSAAAHEFIAALPNGYDTRIGENGVRLSGGQRQRLAIARAMLKDAPILLLDEATSSLDSESERHVQTALKTLMRGRTTLVIAHRLATVRDADHIYVLDAGRVVETGRHAELLARGGVYARLYGLQMQPADAEGRGEEQRIAAVGGGAG